MPDNYETVRWLTLEEIAELWSRASSHPKSVILEQLRLAVLNLPRLRRGEPLIPSRPPDHELPDPNTTRMSREEVQEFCAKQPWALPRFWFAAAPGRGRVGRPSLAPQILQEMERRAEADELESTISAEGVSLLEWVRQAHPQWSYAVRTIKKIIGPRFRQLRPVR